MERSCNCCAYHSYNTQRQASTGFLMRTKNPSPTWPLVLLCVVFVLLMGPVVIEPPEGMFSIGMILTLMLSVLLLLALHFFLSPPKQELHTGTHMPLSAYGSHGYAYSSHHSTPPADEPLCGWGLFFMFILAIILVPLTR